MLGWFVKRRLSAYKRDFNYDAGYMREMFEISPRAFFRFAKIVGGSELPVTRHSYCLLP